MYFIYDCNDKVVGNAKGYATYRGAAQQAEQHGSPAYRAIWDAFYNKYPTEEMPEFVQGRLVHAIKLKEENNVDQLLHSARMV